MSIIVRDYRALAVYCFRKVLNGKYGDLCDRGHAADIDQEITLAAWQAEREQLGTQPAMRVMCRAAYRFMRNLGYRRPGGRGQWQDGETCLVARLSTLI
jgi:hypothetical protein